MRKKIIHVLSLLLFFSFSFSLAMQQETPPLNSPNTVTTLIEYNEIEISQKELSEEILFYKAKNNKYIVLFTCIPSYAATGRDEKIYPAIDLEEFITIPIIKKNFTKKYHKDKEYLAQLINSIRFTTNQFDWIYLLNETSFYADEQTGEIYPCINLDDLLNNKNIKSYIQNFYTINQSFMQRYPLTTFGIALSYGILTAALFGNL